MMLELETEPHYPRHTRNLPPEAGAERRGDHYRVIPGDGDQHHPETDPGSPIIGVIITSPGRALY